ncbi:PQQ-dependent sugar dehydrogenase [Pseudaminobacter soli (ex Li et al. 2025)]|nr:PQQ-dependent sugar dehydrogenase [Mesorhizobium soli]
MSDLMRPTKSFAWVFALLLLCTGLVAAAAAPRVFDTKEVKVQADILASGLEHPWGLAFLPSGDVIVTERPGRMRIFSDGKLSKPIAGLPKIAVHGQGGLLDVVASLNFASDQLVFFTFAEPGKGGSGTAAARGKLVREGENARLEDVKIIYSMKKKTSSPLQFGSRLVFAPDGTLFITTGDRGEGMRAQDKHDSAGAVLRVEPDGSIPPDNPYADGKKGLPALWSKGHRNIQGAAYDPLTKGLITTEHGPMGGDEVNRPEAGKNYGWPIITYGRDYSGAKIGIGTAAPGYEQPLYYWDPSIAPSGLAIYEGSMFPEWKNDLLVGALKFELIARLTRDAQGKITGEERMFKGAFGRIRDVREAPDGSVWLLTDEEDGQIIRLSRAK